jgi:hypothetical protein
MYRFSHHRLIDSTQRAAPYVPGVSSHRANESLHRSVRLCHGTLGQNHVSLTETMGFHLMEHKRLDATRVPLAKPKLDLMSLFLYSMNFMREVVEKRRQGKTCHAGTTCSIFHSVPFLSKCQQLAHMHCRFSSSSCPSMSIFRAFVQFIINFSGTNFRELKSIMLTNIECLFLS